MTIKRFTQLIAYLLFVGLFLLTPSCASLPGGDELTKAALAPAQPVEQAWYSVYFTDPASPTSKSYRGGPDRFLAQAIDQARLSVDIAAYQLNLWSIRDALLDAHRRGVRVRLVTDSDNLDEDEVQELIRAGVPVLGDRREGLMHNKFVVIDRRQVWSGSMNLTVNSAYKNNDNLLAIRSPQVAEDYTVEFEEMFVDDRFGEGSPADTPHPIVEVDGNRVEVYFSPDDGVAARLAELLGDARESIHILAYSFTSDELARLIRERAAAGVLVSGVFERQQVESNLGGEFENFLRSGLDVRLDGNPANLHHKVLIIDRRIVVSGSYNFSQSAETRNDENLLVIHNADIAALYLGEFERMLAQAR
jgi:phosphatidylserine/phosphatidylglycerophosphate/cardiolipin synthase-like enzyme